MKWFQQGIFLFCWWFLILRDIVLNIKNCWWNLIHNFKIFIIWIIFFVKGVCCDQLISPSLFTYTYSFFFSFFSELMKVVAIFFAITTWTSSTTFWRVNTFFIRVSGTCNFLFLNLFFIFRNIQLLIFRFESFSFRLADWFHMF